MVANYTIDPSQEVGQSSQRPIDKVLAALNNPRVHFNYISARCPAHNDKESSFSAIEYDDGHVGIKCFAGCSTDILVENMGLKKSDLFPSNGKRPHRTERKIELFDLAEDKGIHPTFLFNLGIVDGYPWYGTKVIRIPYYTMDGQEYSRARIRENLIAKAGSKWEGPESDPIIPYGLDRLQQARDTGYLWLVEGESDCWTLWMYQLPALGIPGAAMTDKIQQEHVDAFPPVLYLSHEPDKGGDTFIEKIKNRLAELNYQGKIYDVSLRAVHDVKDPNALHQKLFNEQRLKDFKPALQQAIEAARLLNTSAIAQEPSIDAAAIQATVYDAIEKQNAAALYDLAEQIVLLDTKTKDALSGSIKDGMKRCSSFSWSSFKNLLKEAKQKQVQREHEQQVYVSGKPQIILGRQLEDEVDNVLEALYKANNPPSIFIRSSALVRLRLNEYGNPSIEALDENSLIERLARIADFVTYNQEKDSYSSTHPTARIAHSMLSTPEAKPEWTPPILEGFTEIPIIRSDGTILDTPGYDRQTRLYYVAKPNMLECKIPEFPTQEEISKSKDILETCIGEFPYEAEFDKANMYGAMLTAITRYFYKSDVQTFLINATKQGTGKGLIAHLLSILATGRTAPVAVFPQKEEEVKKVIDAKVLNGASIMIFDNIKRKFESTALDALVTGQGRYSIRPLGQTKDIVMDNVRMMVIATGNNIQLDTDQARRCCQIRLTSPVSNPDERDDFTIKNLIEYTQDHRAEIVAALLTLMRAWIVAGKPAAQNKLAKSASTFADWANTVGGILDYAGIYGFQGNRKKLQSEANQEEEQTTAFLATLREIYGEKGFTVKNLAEILTIAGSHGNFAGSGSTTLPANSSTEFLLETLPDEIKKVPFEPQNRFKIVLGKWLEKRVKTPYGPDNLHLEQDKDKHTKIQTWSIVAGSAGSAGSQMRSIHKENGNSFLQEESKEKKYIGLYSGTADLTTRTLPARKKSEEENIVSSQSTGGMKPIIESFPFAGRLPALPANSSKQKKVRV